MFFYWSFTSFNFSVTFIMSSANAFNLNQSKNLPFEEGLMSDSGKRTDRLWILHDPVFLMALKVKHFLLFPQCFPPYHGQTVIISASFILSSTSPVKLIGSKKLFIKNLNQLLNNMDGFSTVVFHNE